MSSILPHAEAFTALLSNFNIFQVTEALHKMDDLIGDLMDGLYRLNMHKCLNIIITSDHGTIPRFYLFENFEIRCKFSIEDWEVLLDWNKLTKDFYE